MWLILRKLLKGNELPVTEENYKIHDWSRLPSHVDELSCFTSIILLGNYLLTSLSTGSLPQYKQFILFKESYNDQKVCVPLLPRYVLSFRFVDTVLIPEAFFSNYDFSIYFYVCIKSSEYFTSSLFFWMSFIIVFYMYIIQWEKIVMALLWPGILFYVPSKNPFWKIYSRSQLTSCFLCGSYIHWGAKVGLQ